VHARFHLHGILERAGRHGDRFLSQHCGIALRIGLFVDAVPIQVGAKVQLLAVELREGRRDLHGEAHDLIGHELFFKGSARVRTVIDDADAIAAVETIHWAMVARIGIVEHADRHALDGFRAGDRGHIGEKFMLNRLQRPFSNLATIVPFIPDLVREIVGGLGNDTGVFRCNRRGPSTPEEQQSCSQHEGPSISRRLQRHARNPPLVEH